MFAKTNAITMLNGFYVLKNQMNKRLSHTTEYFWIDLSSMYSILAFKETAKPLKTFHFHKHFPSFWDRSVLHSFPKQITLHGINDTYYMK